MKRLRFPIDSDLLELLIAFDDSVSLSRLAKVMSRDSSVVSRSLARLGEGSKLLTKNERKWSLTSDGRKLIQLTKAYIKSIQGIFEESGAAGKERLPGNACLLIVNAQQAMQSPSLGRSSNNAASKNIRALLEIWRHADLPIIHAKHVSKRPQSVFFHEASSCEFMPGLEPLGAERTLEKSKPSAFADTDLAKILDKMHSQTVVIVGYTAQDCVDSTAKHAAALGLNVWLVSDGIAQFEITGRNGKVFSAEDVHEIVLAGLSESVSLVTTSHVRSLLEAET